MFDRNRLNDPEYVKEVAALFRKKSAEERLHLRLMRDPDAQLRYLIDGEITILGDPLTGELIDPERVSFPKEAE